MMLMKIHQGVLLTGYDVPSQRMAVGKGGVFFLDDPVAVYQGVFYSFCDAKHPLHICPQGMCQVCNEAHPTLPLNLQSYYHLIFTPRIGPYRPNPTHFSQPLHAFMRLYAG